MSLCHLASVLYLVFSQTSAPTEAHHENRQRRHGADRPHPPGPPEQSHGRLRGRSFGQAGKPEPAEQREGSHRREHDFRGRACRQNSSRQDGAGGADQREHGHRSGIRRGCQRIQTRDRDARHDESGAARPSARVRRGARAYSRTARYDRRDHESQRNSRQCSR